MGYIDYSMSVNAQNAYADGLLPLSKIHFSSLEEVGIKMTLKHFKALVKSGSITSDEWHHTSMKFNRTEFYDLDRIKDEINDGTIDASISIEKKEDKEYYADCEWIEWCGSRKHPVAIHCHEKCMIRGGWAYRENGSKKSINGLHFKILKKVV